MSDSNDSKSNSNSDSWDSEESSSNDDDSVQQLLIEEGEVFDDILFLFLIKSVKIVETSCPNYFVLDQLCWLEYVQLLFKASSTAFYEMCRMTYQLFNKLCHPIHPIL